MQQAAVKVRKSPGLGFAVLVRLLLTYKDILESGVESLMIPANDGSTTSTGPASI